MFVSACLDLCVLLGATRISIGAAVDDARTPGLARSASYFPVSPSFLAPNLGYDLGFQGSLLPLFLTPLVFPHYFFALSLPSHSQDRLFFLSPSEPISSFADAVRKEAKKEAGDVEIRVGGLRVAEGSPCLGLTRSEFELDLHRQKYTVRPDPNGKCDPCDRRFLAASLFWGPGCELVCSTCVWSSG